MAAFVPVNPEKQPLVRSTHNVRRSVTLHVATALAATGGLAAVRVLNDNGVHLPGCPFRAVVGFDCPGCGSTRAMLRLTHFDVLGAIDYNVLCVVGVVILAWTWVAGAFRTFGKNTRAPLEYAYSSRVVLAVVLLFWSLRLTPGPVGMFLSSGPR